MYKGLNGKNPASKANAALLRIQMARFAGAHHKSANLLKSEVSSKIKGCSSISNVPFDGIGGVFIFSMIFLQGIAWKV
ncbi:hypothetical protein HPL003_04220 [Paenibacillus terrae HPL-003]|uniref:Uncharacterized protein n=1 Tax=Paenibacillus terrae (strain HPL-003) TaxID=985665 RepID=G7VUK8_PAETH|nr:hypothetical protein HPL003_04220 [Paenibacillus terrae HPL-003]